MGIIKTKGIIISEYNTGDYDKMLIMLTPGLGKISCIARGARRPKSALLASSQFLCFGDYILYKGTSEVYSINSCEPIEIFYNIRTDLDKLECVAHITKILLDVTTENENSYKILQLYLNTIYLISEKEKNLNFITSVFKLRLISIIGFTPQIKQCVNCKDTEEIKYFSIKDNGFKCGNCGKLDTGAIQISETTKKAIQYIISADPKKIFSFCITLEAEKELEIVSKLYLNQKLEKQF